MNDLTAMRNDQASGAPAEAAAVERLLGPRSGRRGRRWLRALVWVLLILGLIAVVLWWRRTPETVVTRYETARVERGDLTVRVSATGTLQPTNQVDVGSELSGLIQSVQVDDNDLVKRGDVLARLDVSKLEDQIANSRAALAVAQANVKLAEASRREAEVKLRRQREVYRLSSGKVPSQTEMETAEAEFARADAGLASAAAAVVQAQATLRANETDLEKASIRSPIDGVVLARQIEPGQTVAASLQAPVLFTLAENLAQMELQVDVDEADVGQVREGQQASFTVDAYPDRQYPAVITRVSYGATTTDNVVTYLTVLEVDNDDLSLRPGMTASADITTQHIAGAILVPNAALRFVPPQTRVTQGRGLVASLLPRPPRTEKVVRVTPDHLGEHRVWVSRDGLAHAVVVSVGASDGRMTAVTSDELDVGAAVITGVRATP